jgi:hypothetical protein
MIYKARSIGTYLVAAVAVFGCLAVAACQSGRLPANRPASAALAAQPLAPISCGASPDAWASWLRSQGFSAQAAKNLARDEALDCVPVPACAAGAESAAALRARGFSAQAIKNITELARRDC